MKNRRRPRDLKAVAEPNAAATSVAPAEAAIMREIYKVLCGFEGKMAEIHRVSMSGRPHPDAQYREVTPQRILTMRPLPAKKQMELAAVVIPAPVFSGLVEAFKRVKVTMREGVFYVGEEGAKQETPPDAEGGAGPVSGDGETLG